MRQRILLWEYLLSLGLDTRTRLSLWIYYIYAGLFLKFPITLDWEDFCNPLCLKYSAIKYVCTLFAREEEYYCDD